MTSAFAGSALLGQRAIERSRRNPASVLGAVVFPLLFFALFNVVLRRVMDAQGFDYVQLLPPTIVVQAMLFAGMSSAYYVADDRLSGITERFASLPIGRAAPAIGRALGDLARAAVSLVVVIGVGVAAGMRFDAGLVWIPLFVLVALLFSLAVALGMGLLGLSASSPEAAVSLATIPYLPLLMLSSGFAPIENFPDWLEPIVRNQPVTVTIDALRALAGDGDISSTVPVALAWTVGLAVLFAAVGVRVIGGRR
ncbi:MAG: ABC transporter permease [Actinomycetota bacterium]